MTADTPAWDGVPENPERDGEHLFMEGRVKRVSEWSAKERAWTYPGADWHSPEDVVRYGWRYVGPLYAPADLAARIQAEREAVRAMCAKAANGPYHEHSIYDERSVFYGSDCNPDRSDFGRGKDTGRKDATRSIRALDLGPTDALAQAIAAAEARGMKWAADMVDCGCPIRNDVLSTLQFESEREAERLCTHGDVCCALQAAAIRAAIKAPGHD